MTEQPHHPRQHRQVSVRALVGTIMLVVGIIVWLLLVYAIFEFSAAVGEFLKVIIDLGNSASGHP